MLSTLVAPSLRGTQRPLQTLISSHSAPVKWVSIPFQLVYYYAHFVILPKFFFLSSPVCFLMEFTFSPLELARQVPGEGAKRNGKDQRKTRLVVPSTLGGPACGGAERPSLLSTSTDTPGKGGGDKLLGTLSSLRPQEKPDTGRRCQTASTQSHGQIPVILSYWTIPGLVRSWWCTLTHPKRRKGHARYPRSHWKNPHCSLGLVQSGSVLKLHCNIYIFNSFL